jgi:hypothetical protein
VGFGSALRTAWNAASDTGRKAAAAVAASLHAAETFVARIVTNAVHDGEAATKSAVAGVGTATKNVSRTIVDAATTARRRAEDTSLTLAVGAYRQVHAAFGKKPVKKPVQPCPRQFYEIYYDVYGREIRRVETSEKDRHFLVSGDKNLRLDDALTPGDSPYHLHEDPETLNQVAVQWAKHAPFPAYLRVLDVVPKLARPAAALWPVSGAATLWWIKQNSAEGHDLDAKTWLSDTFGHRTLWNAGDGLYVHNDKVGNAAWGYYMDNRAREVEWVALFGARVQSAEDAGVAEDPMDQDFIRRGYNIPRR